MGPPFIPTVPTFCLHWLRGHLKEGTRTELAVITDTSSVFWWHILRGSEIVFSVGYEATISHTGLSPHRSLPLLQLDLLSLTVKPLDPQVLSPPLLSCRKFEFDGPAQNDTEFFSLGLSHKTLAACPTEVLWRSVEGSPAPSLK